MLCINGEHTCDSTEGSLLDFLVYSYYVEPASESGLDY